MFDSNSRYAKQPIYSATVDGRTVSVVDIPLPTSPALAGYHRRAVGERLDFIAARYMKDATRFWVLCDLANALVPSALAARDLVPIPRGGRT